MGNKNTIKGTIVRGSTLQSRASSAVGYFPGMRNKFDTIMTFASDNCFGLLSAGYVFQPKLRSIPWNLFDTIFPSESIHMEAFSLGKIASDSKNSSLFGTKQQEQKPISHFRPPLSLVDTAQLTHRSEVGSSA